MKPMQHTHYRGWTIEYEKRDTGWHFRISSQRLEFRANASLSEWFVIFVPYTDLDKNIQYAQEMIDKILWRIGDMPSEVNQEFKTRYQQNNQERK
jgi:hypothetical protein